MKKILMLLAVFFLMFNQPINVNADGTEKSIVLVVDLSESMVTNDPNRYAIDSITYLMDIASSLQDFEIGVVTFSETVLYSTETMVSLDDTDRINQIKDELSSVDYFGFTDVSIGLEEAFRMAKEDTKIIVVGDGDRYTMSYQEADKIEADERINSYSTLGNEIYSINLKYGGEIALDQVAFMTNLSETSGATYSEIADAKSLKDSLLAIINTFDDELINEVDRYISDGTPRDYVMDIDELYDSYTLSVYSESPISAHVVNPDGESVVIVENGVTSTNVEGINVIENRTYTIIEFTDPKLGNWDYSITAIDGDYVKIDKVVGEAFVKPEEIISSQSNQTEYEVEDTGHFGFAVDTYLHRETEFFETAVVLIKDSEGTVLESKEFSEPMENYILDYQFLEEGTYAVEFSMSSSYYGSVSDSHEVTVIKVVDYTQYYMYAGIGIGLLILLFVLYKVIQVLKRDKVYNVGTLTVEFGAATKKTELDGTNKPFTLADYFPFDSLEEKEFVDMLKKIKFKAHVTNESMVVTIPEELGKVDRQELVIVHDDMTVELDIESYDTIFVTYNIDPNKKEAV